MHTTPLYPCSENIRLYIVIGRLQKKYDGLLRNIGRRFGDRRHQIRRNKKTASLLLGFASGHREVVVRGRPTYREFHLLAVRETAIDPI